MVAQYQAQSWEDEKGKETMLLPQNILIQDSEGNAENEYLVPDSNKTKINMPRNPKMSTRTPLKKKSCK
jgi:hypothetical protein